MKPILSLIIAYLAAVTLDAQPINNLVKDVVMPPPNASSLGKYGDIPVSYYTGVPSIGVPIYTLIEGNLSLPISLDYHSSGVRVGENASWSGLGWSLNTGGIVSRSALGKPDERANGYLVIASNFQVPQSCTLNPPDITEISQGDMDGEADIFSFSAGGYSGKFFFRANGEIVQVPKQDINITPIYSNGNSANGGTANPYNFKRFEITLPDGAKYLFGDIGDGNIAIELMENETMFKTANIWYLKKIQSPDGKFSINFQYADEYYSYRSLPSRTSAGSSESYNTMWIEGKRLSTIQTSTETVRFLVGDVRDDLRAHPNKPFPAFDAARELDQIKIDCANTDFCKTFNLTTGYFKDNSTYAKAGEEDYRLKLESIQEISCAVGQSISVPSYEFTYFENPESPDFLPNRLSRAIDHWGFYNGADENNNMVGSGLNIPYTKITYYVSQNNPVTVAMGQSNRETNEAPMKWGTLQKITYPTGGSTEFDFEANDYWDTVGVITTEPTAYGLSWYWPGGQCVTANLPPTEATYTFSAADLPYLRYTWMVNGIASTTYCPCNGDGNAQLQITQNNQIVATKTANNDCGNWVADTTYGYLLDLIPALQPNISYKFSLSCTNAGSKFFLEKEVTTETNTNVKVGGLRIKSIKNHDAISTSNDIVRTYEYSDPSEPSKSSGILFEKPVYGRAYDFNFPCNTPPAFAGFPFFSDFGIVPLSSYEGYHISYQFVKENFDGNGYKEFTFSLEDPNSSPPASYPELGEFPVRPTMPRLNAGNMVYSASYNSADAVVEYQSITPFNGELYDVYPDVNFKAMRVSPIILAWSTYYNRSKNKFRQTAVESMRDGVVTQTYYEYDFNAAHLFPTAEYFQNSDGKTHRTEYFYPADADWQTGTEAEAIELMLKSHIIGIPLRVQKKVDGQIVSGTWTEYKDFDSNGLGLYPYKFHSYEVALDANNNPIGQGLWALKGEVTQRYATTGLPHTFALKPTAAPGVDGWALEEYEWASNGLIKKRKYVDFEWEYDYYPGTRLLKSITDIDDQITNYEYDGLMRLKEISAREGRVRTIFTYKYGMPDEWEGGNWVHTKIDYEGFTDQSTFSYFDGLGRPLDTWRKGYGPLLEDIVSEKFSYDNMGRAVEKVYLPDIKGGLTYTQVDYEKSPLGRQEKETYPDGNSVMTSYGKDGNYYQVKVTDENGNATLTNTDIVGRKSKVTDAMGGVTNYFYDYKDNLVKITNPEQQEYLFTFDKRNRLKTKEVPGSGCQEYMYNDRDLQVAYRDANLRTESGKWIVNEYDIYGRTTRTGFSTQNSPNSPGPCNDLDPQLNFAIGEELITNTYDVNNAIGNCNSTYTPWGKLTATTAAIINENGAIDGSIPSRHCFDAFGRIRATESGSLLGTDRYEFNIDIADHLTNTHRLHSGQLGIETTDSIIFDHGGRKVEHSHNIKVYGVPSLGDQIIGTYYYNTKDQLKSKVAGGLAISNYAYNERGWLTMINAPGKMELLDTAECVVPPDDPTGTNCGECGDYLLSLPQLLNIRFTNEINIDCYVPCDCGAQCDPTQTMPCPDSTFIGGGSGPTDGATIRYPNKLYDIVKCSGEENHVLQDSLPQVSENYTVIKRYDLKSPAQMFRVGTQEGEQIVDVPGLMGLAAAQGDIDIRNNDNGSRHDCEECTEEPPSCTPQELIDQQTSLNIIESNHFVTHVEQLSFPTNLMRIRLCDGREIYLFSEELKFLQGSYMILQTVTFSSEADELAVGVDANPDHMTVWAYLTLRTLEDGWFINYYKPCENNECTQVGQRMDSRSVGASVVFSTYDNQPPYDDLTSYIPGSQHSLLVDNVMWDMKYTKIRKGESEWDIGMGIPPDAVLSNYEAVMAIGEFWGCDCRVGLSDGNGLVKINGGQDFIPIGGSGLGNNSALHLVPDVTPTSAQLSNMKVVLFHQLKGMQVDGVYAKFDYTEPCDRCAQEPPACSDLEQQEQMASLDEIIQFSANVSLYVPVPSFLYRVQLCNGDEVYLLQSELAKLVGSFTILQVITINSLTQKFISDIGPGKTGQEGGADAYFSEELRYYAGDPKIPLPTPGYKNGNIAAMYWQTKGKHKMAYEFRYDDLDRLDRAWYANIYKDDNGNEVYVNSNAYAVNKIRYDKIGNLLEVLRKGPLYKCEAYGGEFPYGSEQIDQLTYTYDVDKARLLGVADGGTTAGFRHSTTYGYDNNGNITLDYGKLMAVSYNYLNLPRAISKGGPTAEETGDITYKYDATGRRLYRGVDGVLLTPNNDVSVLYGDGIELTNGIYYSVYHDEGRVTWAKYPEGLPNAPAPVFQYEAMVKDHLGNVRVTVSRKTVEDEPIIEESHYYPFGMEMEGNWRFIQDSVVDWTNYYRYNGKPFDRELGLEWYMYGARMYDPAVGRFTGVDPIAEKFPHLSAFNYASNDPISKVDLHGLQGVRRILWWAVKELIFEPAPPPPTGWVQPPRSMPSIARDNSIANVKVPSELLESGSTVTHTYNSELKIEVEETVETKLLPEKAGPAGEISPSEVEGKTPSEIDSRAKELGLEGRGPDPKNGKGAYVDPQTGQQRILSHPNSTHNGKPNPHGHVNDRNGNRIDKSGKKVVPESKEAHLPIKKENK
ncbi:MAG: hypothetical protein H6577_24825 [Lewinellaceae bacterium]|nr:hypothetical protein [Lewinellaceae bacterium]